MSCPWLLLVCVRVCFVGGFGFGSSLVAALELVLASARGASDRLSGDRYRGIACVLVAWAIGFEQAGVFFRAVVRSVLWSEVRSAGVAAG
jgi:hypothetical protein